MKFKIQDTEVSIINYDLVNSGSVNYYEAEIESNHSWDNLTIEAVLIKAGEDKGEPKAVVNNTFYIDKNDSGIYELGFIGYTIANGVKTYQISTNLVKIFVNKGAGEVELTTPPTPSTTEWELLLQQFKDYVDSEIRDAIGDDY